jgi:hypothetical protein
LITNKVVLAEEEKPIQLSGKGIIFKRIAEDTDGPFALIEHPMEPGTLGAPQCRHENIELISN